MRRRGVEIEVILFDIFAMIALVAGQPKQAFLEDRIPAIPEGEGEADELMPIADASDTILAPAIGLGTGLIVGKIVPGVP